MGCDDGQSPSRTSRTVPRSKLTPSAVAYGLATVVDPRSPPGHSSTIATRVSTPRGARMAERSRVARRRVAIAEADGSEFSVACR